MSKKVLVVDDANFMRQMMKKIIDNQGYEVIEAEDGSTAIEKYKNTKPDLVTMDITMPKMSGVEALKEIKKIDENAKVLMCSAMGQKPIVLEAIEAGAKDFIVKPIKPEKVIENLDKYL